MIVSSSAFIMEEELSKFQADRLPGPFWSAAILAALQKAPG